MSYYKYITQQNNIASASQQQLSFCCSGVYHSFLMELQHLLPILLCKPISPCAGKCIKPISGEIRSTSA